MSLAARMTLFGRRQAENLMESTCAVRRVTGSTRDPDSAQNVPTYLDVWSGPCRLRFPFVRPQQVDAAGELLNQQRGILSVPVDGTSGIQTNDIVTITAAPLDDGMVGVRLRVMGPFFETHATARRLPVQVVT